MTEKKENLIRMSGLRAWVWSVHEARQQNTLHYPMTNLFLMLFYPFFITLMAELNQFKYPSKLVIFISEHPMIILFDFIVAGLIYLGFLLLFRSGWFSMMVQSIIYMALSITELFKYGTNGNHLIMTDMKLMRSMKSLTSFAYIKITPRLILFCALVIVFILVAFWFNPVINRKYQLKKRVLPGITCLGAVIATVVVPTIGNKVYKIFQVSTDVADNTFILNEKFDKNGFLAFFMQEGTENLSTTIEHEEYDSDTESAVGQYLADEDEVKTEGFSDGVQPNVIEIMSESYADFRCFEDELEELGYTNLDEIYAGLDEVGDKGYSGTLITPTYASYTVRTEFELLFGLPVKSLNDPNMPQRVLLDRLQPTIPSYYKSWGYTTAYVHPFQGSFYSRRKIYGNFSFDTMIFEDDFTVDTYTYGDYMDDNVVYNQIESMIASSDEPLYLHTTTMQNHQPYTEGDSDDEFVNYLTRIQHSTDGLADFVDRLEDIDEPTIVIFVGDHFPSLRGDDGIYSQLNITSKNCSELYEQHYVVWANYDLDYSVLPDEPVSVFYSPYLIMQLIDAPTDAFTQAMMDEMEEEPIYSTNYMPMQESNDMLDTLTYDRILGDDVSPNPLSILYPEAEETE